MDKTTESSFECPGLYCEGFQLKSKSFIISNHKSLVPNPNHMILQRPVCDSIDNKGYLMPGDENILELYIVSAKYLKINKVCSERFLLQYPNYNYVLSAALLALVSYIKMVWAQS